MNESIRILIRSGDDFATSKIAKAMNKIRDVCKEAGLIEGAWFESLESFEIEYLSVDETEKYKGYCEEQKQSIEDYKKAQEKLHRNLSTKKSKALAE